MSPETTMFIANLAVRAVVALAVYFGGMLIRRYKIERWVADLVNAAEQYFGDGNGELKKQWVIDKMHPYINKWFGISREDLEVLIEAAVAELNKWKHLLTSVREVQLEVLRMQRDIAMSNSDLMRVQLELTSMIAKKE